MKPSLGSARARLVALCACALAARAGYLAWQAAHDPTIAHPLLDQAVYLDWARSLLDGNSSPAGAYYLAPLYPHVLALALALTGGSVIAVFALQQVAVVAAAILVGRVAARSAGEGAGLAATALLLAYHPALFFASRAVGEALALVVCAGALALVPPAGGPTWRWGSAGALAALAALSRPNLLPIPFFWAAWQAGARHWRAAAALVVAASAVVVPVTLRNLGASGHLVPISSNLGITLYHGNGPGATGAFTRPHGMTAGIAGQREEAARIATRASGQPLDEVQADGWWARRAVATRLADPADTARLLARRAAWLLGSYEHSLEDSPEIDPNPWHRAAPLPFAALAGLAVAALMMVGPRGSGGSRVWTAAAVAALAPLVFFAASRYRLPFAMILTIPGGVGLAGILGAVASISRGRRASALAMGVAVAGLSWGIPQGGLPAVEEAGAWANLSESWRAGGDLPRALAAARAAIGRDPATVGGWLNLGACLAQTGRAGEAEGAFARALALEPGHPAASARLAALRIERGRPDLAIEPLQRALAAYPEHAGCWTNLVVALAAAGRWEEARTAAKEAAAHGVHLDADLLRTLAAGEGAR